MSTSKLVLTLGLSILGFTAGGAVWSYAQQQPRTITLTPQDYLDIQRLYGVYNRMLDAGDAEKFADTFTPDGTLANSTGRSAIMKSVVDAQARWKGAWRHLYSNLIIEPAPDGAKGSSVLFAYDTSTKPATITNTGIYEDTLVKTRNGWRFKTRAFHSDAPPAR